MLVLNKKLFSDRDDINEDDFIKISLSPDNRLVPDLNNKLPGRSVWLPANKSLITDVLKKEDLKKHFGVPSLCIPDFCSLIERILRKKILNGVSLTKKAGNLVIGLDAIKSQLIQRNHCLILTAKGAKSLPKNNSVFSSKGVSCFEFLLEQKDLEKCTGKYKVKYVGIFSKNFKKTIQVDLNKLKGFIDNH